MQDEKTPTGDAPDPDDAQAEALSRAARDAVRQPADPRLEQSFAKLGLFTEDEVPASPRPGEPVAPVTPDRAPEPDRSSTAPRPPAPTESPAATVQLGSAAPAVDLEPFHAQLATLQAAVEQLDRKVATATSLLIGVVVALVILLVVVLVRG